jgi:hypothetical protein
MNQDKITEVFVEVDDFCQKIHKTIAETRKLALTGQKKVEIEPRKYPILRLLLFLFVFIWVPIDALSIITCKSLRSIADTFSLIF